MSRSGAFCPRCGDPIERPAERSHRRDDRLCDACYIDEYDLVDAPDRIEISVCAQCGAVHRGNRWVDVGAEDYTDVAIDELTDALSVHVNATGISWQVTPEQVDQTTIKMHVQFSGVLRETALSEELMIPVKIGRETCTRCGRIAGGSYAGVVQLRAIDREPTDDEKTRAREIAEDLVEELENKGDREAFVTEVNDVPGGLDLRLSTTRLGERIARQVTAELGGQFTDHETLVTEDSDGNEVYRVTFAVRLPPYRPGEIVDPGDGEGPVLVESAREMMRGRRLKTGDVYETPFEDGTAPDADRLGRVEEAEETTLVAVEDEHALQVLDPETYETKSVPRPPSIETDAETVQVFRGDDGLYVLPETDE